MDWQAQPRRPFKRAFMPFDPHAIDQAGGLEKVSARRLALGVDLIEDPAGEDATSPPVTAFEELGVLPPWLLQALQDSGKFELSPVQAQALPVALSGQNVIVVSSALGIGDEALPYLIPAALQANDQHLLSEEEPGPIALVLAATQEASEAVANSAAKLLKTKKTGQAAPCKVVNVSGGGARSEKLQELGDSGAHIVVGTPKRLYDMASKNQVSLMRVTLFVLDGADRMLEMGFQSEVQQLAAWIRPERQTLVLCKTWPRQMHMLAAELCRAGGLPVRLSFKTPPSAAVAAAAAARAWVKPKTVQVAKPSAPTEGVPAKAAKTKEVKEVPKSKGQEAAVAFFGGGDNAEDEDLVNLDEFEDAES
eukprot:TRINITY_DN3595_c0_g2_i1.p1 TRINITY_DN3595_c0_g2~~TRINITY_DN3595_c0_g2_i1.p1  ORF type:complete len:395 (+),score=104.79 TRINITY_DN3595_c0_g2_i1:96-1187(+)